MHATTLESLPIAVIAGGPVGLAAAAHLIARNLPVKLYEAGPAVGANLRDWGHVRVFTPWRYCVDAAAAALLDRQGWRRPDANRYPTGAELVSSYLEPLAATPELAAVIESGARVTSISRHGLDKVVSRGREARPFVLSVATAAGARRDLARAVIDASGTWSTPKPARRGRPASRGRVRAFRSDWIWDP
jgi:NADPH-dependent 2,4-dienoyl-CoA reductase/sulfur reductase-like enzyme